MKSLEVDKPIKIISQYEFHEGKLVNYQQPSSLGITFWPELVDCSQAHNPEHCTNLSQSPNKTCGRFRFGIPVFCGAVSNSPKPE